MVTVRQKIAFKEIVENRGNVSKAMKKAKYSLASARNPRNLTQSKGFQELCDKIGLTDEFLTKALVSDIKGKPKNRKPELELGFKIRGRLKDDEKGDKTQVNIFVGDQLKRIAARVLNGDTEGKGTSD